MANDFQSKRLCEKCLNKGYYNTQNDSTPNGDVFLFSCECVSLNELECEAIAELKLNKIKNMEYNANLNLLNPIKRKRL